MVLYVGVYIYVYIFPGVPHAGFFFGRQEAWIIYRKKCNSHMKVYLKEEIPDRFPCFNSMKIQPVILVADEGSESVCVCVYMCSESD